jgi:hypothetical protein
MPPPPTARARARRQPSGAVVVVLVLGGKGRARARVVSFKGTVVPRPIRERESVFAPLSRARARARGVQPKIFVVSARVVFLDGGLLLSRSLSRALSAGSNYNRRKRMSYLWSSSSSAGTAIPKRERERHRPRVLSHQVAQEETTTPASQPPFSLFTSSPPGTPLSLLPHLFTAPDSASL